jgi:predicted metal-dependent HD superfamily phosphohydrolase
MMTMIINYKNGFFKGAQKNLTQLYNSQGRYHHVISHVHDMLDLLRNTHPKRLGPMVFAIWYHDAVYDPTRTDNEEKSAELMFRDFGSVIDPDELNFSKSLILASKHMFPSIYMEHDHALMIDLDLYVLSRTHSYSTYAQNIRNEYIHVSGEEFRRGRITFLKRTLSNPIYKHFTRLEQEARSNILEEIEFLSGRESAVFYNI